MNSKQHFIIDRTACTSSEAEHFYLFAFRKESYMTQNTVFRSWRNFLLKFIGVFKKRLPFFCRYVICIIGYQRNKRALRKTRTKNKKTLAVLLCARYTIAHEPQKDPHGSILLANVKTTRNLNRCPILFFAGLAELFICRSHCNIIYLPPNKQLGSSSQESKFVYLAS